MMLVFLFLYLVSESIEAIEDDSNVCGGYPFLELSAVFEVIGAWSAFECAERNRAAAQRCNVRELVCAQCNSLVLSCHNASCRHIVHFLTIRTVILVRLPLAVFTSPLLNAERFRSW